MKNRGMEVLGRYIFIVLAIGSIALFLLYMGGKGAIAITDAANDYYLPFYKQNVKGFVSPWYRNGLHIVDEEFVDELDQLKENEKNIIVIGSSMSVIPLREEEVDLRDGYQYLFLVCGNGSWRSDQIMDNLVRQAEGYDASDIVKFEISFSTFRDMEKSITETVLDKWGKYSVNKKNLSVKKNSFIERPLYWINLQLLRMQNVWELFMSGLEQLRVPGIKALGNFKNNYFNYESVAESCNMTQSMQESVEKEILKLNQDSNLVVELTCLPPGLAATDFGRELNRYIDTELIPLLEKNKIIYLDYRNDYRDDEFADGVHLSYDSACQYTRRLNEDMNELIGKR